ncbi:MULTISPECIES: universal stress protein [Neptunomonas]|uniref:Nucleotide-binding universal stress protein, UspA family n=1 Tax=Neptunomonas qingdaonensis TaxID=1045558 RepID=A0A1I2QSM9_9GAMM|nr:universal stress protein [Neptunomonas qingdaonensis]SFG29277.1 Nucleotide-binding universal stress protein, UspA family [Neptunomonas qingdaonensis]
MLPEINHILYASDLGKNSREVFRLAAKLAFDNKAHITFLNVLEPIGKTTEEMMAQHLSEGALKKINEDGLTSLKKKIEHRIEIFCQQELPDGFEYPQGYPEALVMQGRPEEVIIEEAERLGVDMIVMGTRTHSSLKKLFLGSTAQRVLQESKVPVIIVPL